MIKVVLDVNILASAALNDVGVPARVANLAFDGDIELAVSRHIIEKLEEVFDRPFFLNNLSVESRSRLLTALRTELEPTDPDESVRGVADDLEDDLVLGTAVAANADVLVTGDKGLLAIGEYRGVRILTAGAFLDELVQE